MAVAKVLSVSWEIIKTGLKLELLTKQKLKKLKILTIISNYFREVILHTITSEQDIETSLSITHKMLPNLHFLNIT